MTRAAMILEKYIELYEIAAKRTISFRGGGKRHIRWRCPPGFKKVNRSCVRIPMGKRIQTNRKLKKAWKSKRRGKMVKQKISRNRTFRKMRSSGYKPGGGRR